MANTGDMPLRYRPEIDGLRAVAVLAVVLYHAEFVVSGINPFQGGFIGVDVFFVISGYLITSIILRDLERGAFRFSNFYERRARRILPPLLTVIGVSAIWAWASMLPSAMEEFSASALSSLAFVSNVLFWQQDSYWAEPSQLKPLLHTWSLSVEEQFYILFPLSTVLLVRFQRRRVLAAFAVVFVASLAASEYGSRHYPEATFYLIHARIWELLAGAMLAKRELDHGREHHSGLTRLMPSLGLLLIVGSVVFFDQDTRHPSLLTLIPVIGTMMVIWFGRPDEPASRALSRRPFVAVGLVSYGFYLWHYPVFAFARVHDRLPSDTEKCLHIALALALATLSYFLVERPARSQTTLSRPRLIRALVASSVVLGLFSYGGVRTAGFEAAFAARFPSYVTYQQEVPRERQFDNKECHFYGWEINERARNRLEECYRKFGPGLFVIGDSHSRDVYNAISLNTGRKFLFQLSWRAGSCRTPGAPKPPGCGYPSLEKYLQSSSHTVDTLIYTTTGHNFFIDRQHGLRWMRLFERDVVPDYDIDVRLIGLIADYLDTLSRRVNVVWLGPRLEPHVRLDQIVKNDCREPRDISGGIKANFTRLDGYLEAFRAAARRYVYRSHMKAIRFDPRSDLYSCEAVYWYDGHHYSFSGERRFGKRIVEYLAIAR